ncbi:MAG: VWA domain-containing protein, partial [Clostridiales bacterium]|nr:VWA domain-containing protein [Clostridiales bacterium]
MTVTPNSEIQTPKIELALVLDYSKSMDNNSTGSGSRYVSQPGKWSTMLAAVEAFINSLDTTGNISVSIIKFGTTANVAKSMTTVTGSNLNQILNSFGSDPSSDFNGYTNIQHAINKAVTTFEDPSAAQSIILFSDGDPTAYYNSSGTLKTGLDSTTIANATQAAKDAANAIPKNISCYTIGFDISSNSPAEGVLQYIAASGSGNGKYYASANDATQLSGVFTEIKKFVVSMISDTVPAPFVIDGNVTVQINGVTVDVIA